MAHRSAWRVLPRVAGVLSRRALAGTLGPPHRGGPSLRLWGSLVPRCARDTMAARPSGGPARRAPCHPRGLATYHGALDPSMGLKVWVVLFALLGATAAEAALSVSSSRVVLRTKPGQVRTGFFTLTNPGDTPVTVKVEPEDWSRGPSGTRQPVSWLTVKPSSLTLRPGKSARVKYVIHVPKQASGELRTQVFFTTEQALGGPGSAPLRSRLGTILYVTIQGTEQVQAEIQEVHWAYTASTPGIAKPDRFEVTVTIVNRGNVHIVPEGRSLLQDHQGHTLYTLPLISGWGLLPNEPDTYHAVLHGVYLSAGRYQLLTELQCGQDIGHPTDLTHTDEIIVDEQGTLRPAPAP